MTKELSPLPPQEELSGDTVWTVLRQLDQPPSGDPRGRTHWEASQDAQLVVDELLAQQGRVE